MAPVSSSSDAPGYRSSSPAAASANWPSVRHPGAVSSGFPDANPDARLAYTPGTLCADPGIPGPRRPAAAAAAAATAAVSPAPASTAASRASSPVIRSASAASSPGSTSGGGSSSGSSTSGSPGSSSAARRARYAGSSIQSGQDGAGRGFSSRPGSGGSGPGGMYHGPFEGMILYEHSKEKPSPKPADTPANARKISVPPTTISRRGRASARARLPVPAGGRASGVDTAGPPRSVSDQGRTGPAPCGRG